MKTELEIKINEIVKQNGFDGLFCGNFIEAITSKEFIDAFNKYLCDDKAQWFKNKELYKLKGKYFETDEDIKDWFMNELINALYSKKLEKFFNNLI